MQGTCDACGEQAELTEYTRKWFGDAELTSRLCVACLRSIKKRPNRAGERIAAPKPPRKRAEPAEKRSDWAAFREWQRSQQPEQPARNTSLVVCYDGKEYIGGTGGQSSRPPSLAKIRKVMRLLVDEDKRRTSSDE